MNSKGFLVMLALAVALAAISVDLAQAGEWSDIAGGWTSPRSCWVYKKSDYSCEDCCKKFNKFPGGGMICLCKKTDSDD